MKRLRSRVAPFVAAVSTVALAFTGTPAHTPEEGGLWLMPFSEGGAFDARPPVDAQESAQLPPAVNMVVLPDGRILYFEQLQGSEAVDASISFQQPSPGRARTRVLALGGIAPAWTTPSPEHAAAGDLTGSEQRQLADGRVLVIGGTEWRNDDESLGLPNGYGRTELYGLRDARMFDPATNTWARAKDMEVGRYYPSMLTLPDGRMIVIGGVTKLLYNTSLAGGAHPAGSAILQNTRHIEVFDPSSGTFTIDDRSASKRSLPLFPRVHLLPNGKLLYTGAGMLFAPGGGDMDSRHWGDFGWFDPATGAWTTAGSSQLGVRSNAFSVMLPLRPPYDSAEIMVAGGTVGPTPSGYVATPFSSILSWRGGNAVTSAMTAPMNAPRFMSSGVVLPDGSVLAINGADRDEVVAPGTARAIRTPEIFDPATRTWTTLEAGSRDRMLHNTAVLLADGSILVGGHAPAPFLYGSHRNAPLSNNFKDPSFEIFKPPYLFRGPRPVVESMSASSISSGGTLRISTPDAGDSTLRVVLSRLPAITHAIDNDQRTVEVAHTVSDAGEITITLPGSAVVPPGPYYVFLMKDNGSGPTPGVAPILSVIG